MPAFATGVVAGRTDDVAGSVEAAGPMAGAGPAEPELPWLALGPDASTAIPPVDPSAIAAPACVGPVDWLIPGAFGAPEMPALDPEAAEPHAAEAMTTIERRDARRIAGFAVLADATDIGRG